MWFTRFLSGWTVAFLAFFVVVEVTCAQQNLGPGGRSMGRSYQPNSPTFSPYLQLLRTQDGVLPNYQQFVRPTQQVRQQFQQQSQNISNLQLQQQQLLQTKVTRQQIQTSPSIAAPTGVVGGFMNFSHFYQLP